MNANESRVNPAMPVDRAIVAQDVAMPEPAMPGRGLTLSDAMILIAALAIGLLFNKWTLTLAYPLIRSGNQIAKDHILMGLRFVMPHLASLSVAMWAISIRRPRPGLEPHAIRPGFLAGAVASSGVAALVGWLALNAATGRGVIWNQEIISMDAYNRMDVFFEPFWNGALTNYGDRIGFAVASAWFAQWMLGRWEAQPGWVDRFGRTLGAGWVFCAALIWTRPLLP